MSNIEKYKQSAIALAIKGNKPLLNLPIKFEEAVKGTQLNVMLKSDEATVREIITRALMEMNMITDGNLDRLKINYIYSIIIHEYPFLKLEEIILVIKDGCLGKFGKIYGKLNIATVMQWFYDYIKQRDDYFETQLEIESSQSKEFRMNTAELNKFEKKINKFKK